MRLVRLGTSHNQGHGGKSGEGREVAVQMQARLGAGGTVVGLRSQRAFSHTAPSARSPPPSSGRGSGSVPNPGNVPQAIVGLGLRS